MAEILLNPGIKGVDFFYVKHRDLLVVGVYVRAKQPVRGAPGNSGGTSKNQNCVIPSAYLTDRPTVPPSPGALCLVCLLLGSFLLHSW